MRKNEERSTQVNLEPTASAESSLERLVENAVLRSVFPPGTTRRQLLKTVGTGAVLSSLSSVFPLGAAKALALERTGSPEKKDLTIGFVAITCGTPTGGDAARSGLRLSHPARLVSGVAGRHHNLVPLPKARRLAS